MRPCYAFTIFPLTISVVHARDYALCTARARGRCSILYTHACVSYIPTPPFPTDSVIPHRDSCGSIHQLCRLCPSLVCFIKKHWNFEFGIVLYRVLQFLRKNIWDSREGGSRGRIWIAIEDWIDSCWWKELGLLFWALLFRSKSCF